MRVRIWHFVITRRMFIINTSKELINRAPKHIVLRCTHAIIVTIGWYIFSKTNSSWTFLFFLLLKSCWFKMYFLNNDRIIYPYFQNSTNYTHSSIRQFGIESTLLSTWQRFPEILIKTRFLRYLLISEIWRCSHRHFARKTLSFLRNVPTYNFK